MKTKTKMTHTRKFLLGSTLALAAPFALPTAVRAADHGDGPTASLDRACDIGDLYMFADVDPTKVVLIGTVQGFIVPSEAVNFTVFDPNVRYRFGIENTGDANIDKTIDVTFSKRTSTTVGQTATIRVSGVNRPATATSSVANLDAVGPALAGTPVVIGGQTVDFFAGEVDDPFFFDIVGFNRFVKKVTATPPDAAGGIAELSRGRDSFAGYNTLAIALRVPIALLQAKNSTSKKIGANFQTQRHLIETPFPNGNTGVGGGFRTIDRIAIPAVNVALVPFALKNRYNASSTQDDKKLRFGLAAGILGTIDALEFGLGKTSQAAAVKTALGNLAVTNGDILRLDTTAAPGFPNGRRLTDDVIDTILGIIGNGPGGAPIPDNVNSSVSTSPLSATFPFLAKPEQPLANPATDDKTRN